jgi:hypothetical protein
MDVSMPGSREKLMYNFAEANLKKSEMNSSDLLFIIFEQLFFCSYNCEFLDD